MALLFEYEKDIETGEQPFICHETNSLLYNYYIEGESAMDKSSSINNGDYEDVTFADEQRHLTTKAVSRIGVKNFPGIGGIGFYKDAYSDVCLIAAPIHIEQEEYEGPILTTVEIVGDKLHIVIAPPSDLAYTCYRVIVEQGPFAFEYILYKTDYFVDIPTVKGEYTCYCVGYDEDTGTISETSNTLQLVVEQGNDTWAPPTAYDSSIEARIKALEESLITT